MILRRRNQFNGTSLANIANIALFGTISTFPNAFLVAEKLGTRRNATMPYYEYKCTKCETVFTVMRSMAKFARAKPVKCPACGSKHVVRIYNPVFVLTSKKS
jgi:putative FmdB family regulatory protein